MLQLGDALIGRTRDLNMIYRLAQFPYQPARLRYPYQPITRLRSKQLRRFHFSSNGKAVGPGWRNWQTRQT